MTSGAVLAAARRTITCRHFGLQFFLQAGRQVESPYALCTVMYVVSAPWVRPSNGRHPACHHGRSNARNQLGTQSSSPIIIYLWCLSSRVDLMLILWFLLFNYWFESKILFAMAKMSEGTKQRLSTVINATKFVVHWGFIPSVIYLGKFLRLARLPEYHTGQILSTRIVRLTLPIITFYRRISAKVRDDLNKCERESQLVNQS